jgi:hypothetical protein
MDASVRDAIISASRIDGRLRKRLAINLIDVSMDGQIIFIRVNIMINMRVKILTGIEIAIVSNPPKKNFTAKSLPRVSVPKK